MLYTLDSLPIEAGPFYSVKTADVLGVIVTRDAKLMAWGADYEARAGEHVAVSVATDDTYPVDLSQWLEEYGGPYVTAGEVDPDDPRIPVLRDYLGVDIHLQEIVRAIKPETATIFGLAGEVPAGSEFETSEGPHPVKQGDWIMHRAQEGKHFVWVIAREQLWQYATGAHASPDAAEAAFREYTKQ